jgi:ribosomal protein L25 (general stress protein Ctc)
VNFVIMLATMQCRVTRTLVQRSALFSTAAVAEVESAVPAQVLQLDLRSVEGSRAARRLRKQGSLPGIVYGEDPEGNTEKVLVSLKTRAFEKIHRKLWTSIENQVFDVQIGDGEPVKALMRDVQFDVGTCT